MGWWFVMIACSLPHRFACFIWEEVTKMQLAKTFSQSTRRPLELISKLWSWLFLFCLIVFFSLAGPGFFDLFNFQSIGANMAIALIMALGQTFVIIAGGIDLSTGFVMGLSSVVAALTITRLNPATPLPLLVLGGIGAGLAAGLIPGLINGWLIARLRVPPFIVTLGMLGIAEGIGFIFSGGGQPVSVQVNGIGQLGNGYLAYYVPNAGLSFFHLPTPLPPGVRPRDIVNILPYPLVALVVLVIICHWLLSSTRFGRHTYAVGGSSQAALRAGIPVVRHTIMIYLLSSLLAAIAGILYVFRYTNGEASSGDPLLLESIAAVVIGGASLYGGEGTIIGTLIGALIIAIIQNGLVIIAVDPYWQYVAVGAVIILAVLVDQARRRVEA
ncbi:ABC transporter permease [Reticulibacter mediterranei]|nr:ABC transporter permease [Reticulibacter mediterranei]